MKLQLRLFWLTVALTRGRSAAVTRSPGAARVGPLISTTHS
jgi:hypothetical protein